MRRGYILVFLGEQNNGNNLLAGMHISAAFLQKLRAVRFRAALLHIVVPYIRILLSHYVRSGIRNTAAGCHFTGPVALCPRVSPSLLLSFLYLFRYEINLVSEVNSVKPLL